MIRTLLTFGEEGIIFPCYFEYVKNKIYLSSKDMYMWVGMTRFLYLLLVIGIVGGYIFWRKRNGNGFIPKPKKENIWGWVKHILNYIENKRRKGK